MGSESWLTGAYLALSSGRHRVWVGDSYRAQERGLLAPSGCSAEPDQACQEPARGLGSLEVGEGGMDRIWGQRCLLLGRPILCTLYPVGRADSGQEGPAIAIVRETVGSWLLEEGAGKSDH